MAIENEINQRKFRTEYQKARINIIYTYNWLSEKINSIFKDSDITSQQFNILRILRGADKPLSTLQIRQRMLDKMSDTSRIVDRLVKKGLVRKTPNDEDRRLVDVVITPKGRKLLEKIDPLEENMDNFMVNLSEEETKALNYLLDKLRNTTTILLMLLVSALSVKAQPAIQPKYEFRGVWVASVENIDWPSKKGLPVDSQKVEFTRLLDMHQRNGFNAMVVQIRPAADAFYPSPYEPWSEWLNGTQGMSPSPYYDPLEFMIEETHRRGMEFHAWINPYRAVKTIGKSSIAPDHITRQHPEWFVRFENTLYFDPGNKEAQDWVTKVVRDIVHRYDIDAVHLDDYFYPYDIVENGPPGKDFPDDPSYSKCGCALSKSDWRRANTDSIILRISKAIKEEKPYCKFGVSPFAIWRNKDKDSEGSDTHTISDYDNLYADIVLWLKMGWVDYVVPQIYFPFSHPRAPYGLLLDWWARHSYGRQCYIGLGIFNAGANAAWRNPNELPHQIQAARSYPQIQGEVYFSSSSFQSNPNGWCDSLQNNYYSYPALIPPMPWLDTVKPHDPVFHMEYNVKDRSATAWLSKGAPADSLRGFAVYRTDSASIDLDSVHAFAFIPYDLVAGFTVHRNPAEEKGPIHFYFVTAVSRNNVESRPVPLIFSNFGNSNN